MDSAKTNRIIITIVILLILAGITTYLIYSQIPASPSSRIEVAAKDETQQGLAGPRRQRTGRAPEALPPLQLVHLDGTPLRLSDYAGKIVLLHSWSSGFPDAADLKDFKPIYDRFLTEERFVMIGLTIDQDVTSIRQMMAKVPMNWKQAMAAPDASAATRELLAISTTIILDRDGNIIAQRLDWWDAFCLLSDLLPRALGPRAEGVVVDQQRIRDHEIKQLGVFDQIPSLRLDDSAVDAKISVVDGILHGLSGPPSVLIDGKLPATHDSPAENLFFIAKSIEGRFIFDFERTLPVKQINTYSWHAHARSPQFYRVYGGDGTAANFDPAPGFGIDPATVGWKLIASVDTRPGGGPGGMTGVSIHQEDPARNLGTFRYLLFLAFPTETHDAQGHTFFGEIDVIEGR